MSEDRDLTPVDGAKRAAKGLDGVTVHSVIKHPLGFYIVMIAVIVLLSFQSAFYIGRMQGKFQPVMQAPKGCPGP